MQQKPEEKGMQAIERPRPMTYLQRMLQPASQEVDAAQSPGEMLLPFFLALAESCWFQGILIGLAGLDFLQSRTALLPFWGVPLLFCAALWLFLRGLAQEARAEESEPQKERDTRSLAGFGPLFSVLALLDVFLIWLHIYAGENFLLDPRWLLNFMNDLLSLNTRFYQALTIVIITIYFCWRATKLGQLKAEPGHVKRQLWVGLLVLPISILLRAGQGQANGSLDDIVLVTLLPTFFYFVLSAHALARTTFLRRVHPFGMEGNITAQERAMLSIIGGAGGILLVLALFGGFFFSTAFFRSFQPTWQIITTVYTWLVNGLTWLLAWILQPIFWLFEQLLVALNHTQRASPQVLPGGKMIGPDRVPVTAAPGIVIAAKVILPFLLLLSVSLALWLALRRRKRMRARRNRASGDVHESVWSWELFWSQFRAFLAALFRRRAAGNKAAQQAESGEELSGEPAARTMREIYRALLKKAAALGYVRRRNETAYEFQARLNQLRLRASNEPQLGQLTDAYSLTRYGGSVPGDFDLASARGAWDELEKKWEQASQQH